MEGGKDTSQANNVWLTRRRVLALAREKNHKIGDLRIVASIPQNTKFCDFQSHPR